MRKKDVEVGQIVMYKGKLHEISLIELSHDDHFCLRDGEYLFYCNCSPIRRLKLATSKEILLHKMGLNADTQEELA